MKRYCYTLDLKDDPGLIEEYESWHKSGNIWPEIVAGIKEVGIQNMEIYRVDTRMFMIIEVPDELDFDGAMKKLSTLTRQKEWENFMDKFQQKLSFAREGEKWVMMNKIFELK